MKVKDITNIPKADNLIVQLIKVESGLLSFIITDDALENLSNTDLDMDSIYLKALPY